MFTVPLTISFRKMYSDMGKETNTGGTYFRNNAETVISLHYLLRKQSIYNKGFTEFRNWENVPLNKEFLEFETVWENNMITRVTNLHI